MKYRIVGCLGIIIIAAIMFVLKNTMVPKISVTRLPDRCPNQIRPDFSKKGATITNINGRWSVTHTYYSFQFDFPDTGWHIEENTIQDLEEPILMPHYLYSVLLTSDGSYSDAHASMHEVRMYIYPSMCNSPQQWSRFLQTQGWHPEASERWTILSRLIGGRKMSLLFLHKGVFHYEFIMSDDATAVVEGPNPEEAMIRTFMTSKGINETAK